MKTKMKIYVGYNKDVIIADEKAGIKRKELAIGETIGYFDSLNAANKAVDKLIKNEEGYVLESVEEHPYGDESVDIVRWYRRCENRDKKHYEYCIEVHYSLILTE